VASQSDNGNGQPRIRVLLCDDADPLRILVSELLSDAPSVEVVGEACHGGECVKLAQELDPDVVLLDMAMPVLDGLQVLKILRDGCPDIPRVVMFSGFDARRFSDLAAELGASGYLEKGAPPSEIVAAIHAAAERDAVDERRRV
jgi:DNA-binding NarL/FixJ family response regulator